MSDAPEQDLARSLEHGLRADFPERKRTALHLAELFLDAVDEALPLSSGRGPVASLELLAQRADVYGWDGPPGWDEVLARGLAERGQVQPAPPPLDGLGAPAARDEQAELLSRRVRDEAKRLVQLAREAAQLGASSGASATELAAHPTLPPGGLLVAAHASLLRLLALSATSNLLESPEDLQAGLVPQGSLPDLLAEIDARNAAGSDFGAAHEEWLARLLRDNPEATSPAFRTFFAGASQALRLSLSLRAWRDEARAGRLPGELETVVGAIGGWQPERWQLLRHGVPAAWMRELCPAEPDAPPLQRLERECERALEVVARLWSARNLSLTGFAALATLLFARTASALALREELR